MPPKTLKYILIIGVAVIWGIIIFRIITAQNEGAIKREVTAPPKSAQPIYDSFSLNADYPDPFLPDTTLILPASQSKKNNAAQIQTNAPIEQSKPDINFIQYIGMISNPQKKIKVAIVQMHGREYLVREKEEFGEVTFLRIEKGGLSVLIKGKMYKINKQR